MQEISRRDFIGAATGAAMLAAIGSAAAATSALAESGASSSSKAASGSASSSASGSASSSASESASASASAAAEEHAYTDQEVYLDYGSYKTYCVIHKPNSIDGDKCPIILVAHGFSMNMQDPMAISICEALAERGVATMQIDFTDNGGSDQPFEDSSVKTDIDQALLAMDYIQDLDWVSKIGMLGHSQGGFDTCAVVSELSDKVDFAILLAPANQIPAVSRTGGYAHVDSWYAGMDDFFDADNLPQTDDMIEAVGVKYNYFESALDMQIWKICEGITCPTLLLWGTKDTFVSLNIAVMTQESIPTCIFHAFKNAGHGFDTCTDGVIAQINKFMDAMLA